MVTLKLKDKNYNKLISALQELKEWLMVEGFNEHDSKYRETIDLINAIKGSKNEN